MGAAAKLEADNQTFPSTRTAFEHACREHDCAIVEETPMLAIVLDAKLEFGATHSITVEQDGCFQVTLKVASEDGGFVLLSRTTRPPKHPLNVGDLVCWVPLRHDLGLAQETNEHRFGWAGLVFATLEPIWEDGEWGLREFYE